MLRRLYYFFNRARLDRELEEEMRFHASAAGQRFGDVTRWRERSRDEWGGRAFDELGQDLRYALRSLRAQPGFAVAAFLLLALGVGANTAIFAVVRAAILSSLPVRDAASLVQLGYHDRAENEFRPDHTHIGFEMFSAQSRTVRELFGFSSPLEVNVIVDGSAGLARAQAVTNNALQVLGVGAPLEQSSLMLTNGYWQRRFGGDSKAIGSTVTVNSVPFVIAGVLPAGFRDFAVGERPDVFFSADRVNEVLMRNARNPGNMWLRIMGRLQPGSTIAQAQAELEPVSRRTIENLYSALPAAMLPQVRKVIDAFQFCVIPAGSGAQSELREAISTPLLVLLGSAALLLLIACMNLAGLALARSVSRGREFGIRIALGCGRGRLMRQLLAESLVVSLLAGGAAWFLAPFARDVLVAMIAETDELATAPDGAVYAFLIGATLLAGVIVGIVPAWRAASNTRIIEDRMVRSPRTARVLISIQVASSVVLIAGAAMFTRTFQSYRGIDPGFLRDRLITVGVTPGAQRYSDEQLLQYYRNGLDRLRHIPGVLSVTLSRWPMGQLSWTSLAEAAGVRDRTSRNLAGSQFASTIGVPLVAGRDFSDLDMKRRTALINESFAKRHFAGAQAIGRQVRFMDFPDHPFEIIGVVKDARDRGQSTPCGRWCIRHGRTIRWAG